MTHDDDLETRLRDLFTGGVPLDVDAPAGTAARVLERTRRARRRTVTVRAVSGVATAAAVGGLAATAGGLGGDTKVEPAKRPLDPRCQEYLKPPTPGPGETGYPWDIPTFAGDSDPLGPQIDPFATDNPLPTFTPRPMRGPHGGVICVEFFGTPEVMTREGFVWPRNRPVPTYSMIPGATPGVSVSPIPLEMPSRVGSEDLAQSTEQHNGSPGPSVSTVAPTPSP